MRAEARRNTLFIIDPQNDFIGMSDGSPHYDPPRGGKGSVPVAHLPVRGAVKDMIRLSTFVDNDANGEGIDDIVVTLDTHEVRDKKKHRRPADIGHPSYWRDAQGKAPAPMTFITKDDVVSGKWRPRGRVSLERTIEYLEQTGGQMVWPRHCVDRTWGHKVYRPLAIALAKWEKRTGKKVHYVRKGMYPHSEQYGAFAAAVPSKTFKSTRFNFPLLHRLTGSGKVWVAGEASSHCVASTVTQASLYMTREQKAKWTLLTDCMSPVDAVPGLDFPKLAAEFLDGFEIMGMTKAASTKQLAAAA